MNELDVFSDLPDYRDWRPTGMDPAGLAGEREGINNFKVFMTQTRDSAALERSNFAVALEALGGESEHVQVHRFRHWACGWFEIILISPLASDFIKRQAGGIIGALSDYPVLNDEHFSQLEREEADRLWYSSFTPRLRVQYIREHRHQFEFQSLADLRACVRGDYFAGYADELLS
jgi:hypothetical protein